MFNSRDRIYNSRLKSCRFDNFLTPFKNVSIRAWLDVVFFNIVRWDGGNHFLIAFKIIPGVIEVGTYNNQLFVCIIPVIYSNMSRWLSSLLTYLKALACMGHWQIPSTYSGLVPSSPMPASHADVSSIFT